MFTASSRRAYFDPHFRCTYGVGGLSSSLEMGVPDSRFHADLRGPMKKSGLAGARASANFAFAVLIGLPRCQGATSPPKSSTTLGRHASRSESIKVRPGSPPLKRGVYQHAGGTVYVGIGAEPPDHPRVQLRRQFGATWNSRIRLRTGVSNRGFAENYPGPGIADFDRAESC
jgi:hypothetical protein